ncbi:hypothetical protein DASB73_040640 [Starmerella bacillaris]|uniref:Uncharacterized protein n=1 Tax=Starmerella bacillaris TaxID=1247836 RepID=A0AAV5RNK9_STABA|nr:hypothetical protein DASB73_040640 [Starmerella bacillaris]
MIVPACPQRARKHKKPDLQILFKLQMKQSNSASEEAAEPGFTRKRVISTEGNSKKAKKS